MRKAFNFFNSYWQTANELPDKDRLPFYDALLHYQFTGDKTKLEQLKGLAKFAYISQSHSLESQMKGYYDNCKKLKISPFNTPALPPALGGSVGAALPPALEVEGKGKEEVEGKDINSRKLKFASTLSEFSNQYNRDLLKSFYDYWTEPNKSNTKFRQELEKTWDLKRRLETWASNDKNFKKPTQITLQQEFINPAYKPFKHE